MNGNEQETLEAIEYLVSQVVGFDVVAAEAVGRNGEKVYQIMPGRGHGDSAEDFFEWYSGSRSGEQFFAEPAIAAMKFVQAWREAAAAKWTTEVEASTEE